MELMIVGALICSAIAVVAVKAVTCTSCRDGWQSSSSGRGTCSWHGGVDD
jgi:hypothetical protein